MAKIRSYEYFRSKTTVMNAVRLSNNNNRTFVLTTILKNSSLTVQFNFTRGLSRSLPTRLGRNIDDLRGLVKDMTAKGVTVQFVKENLTFTGDSSNPFSELMLNMLASFAQFERSIIRERQREGVQIAKAKGIYKGRKREMTDERIAELKRRVSDGEAKAVVAKDMKISRDTLYRYLDSGEQTADQNINL